MVLSKDQQQLRDFLKETIPFLCKSRLDFRSKFTVEAIIGVTVDESDLFYVSLNEDVSAEVVPKLILERPAGTSQFQKVEVLIDHTLVDVAGDEEYHPKKKKKKTALKRGRKRPGSPLLNMSVDEGDMTSNLDSTEIDLDFIKTEMAEPDFESALDDSFIDKSELDDSALDPLPGTSAGPSLLKDGVEDDGDYSDEGGLDDYSGGDHSDQDGTFDSAKDVEASGSIPAKSDNIKMRCSRLEGRVLSEGSVDISTPSGMGSGHLKSVDDLHEPNVDQFPHRDSSVISNVQAAAPKRILRCDTCNYTTRFKQNLERHQRTHVKNYLFCDRCDRKFLDRHSLKKHTLYTHDGPPLICDQCSASFTSSSGLHKHRQTVHNDRWLYKCDICNRTFYDKSQYTGHINSHSDKKAYLCTICGKGFPYKGNLARHEKECKGLNKPTSFQCSECDRTFASQRLLKDHREGKHSDRVYTCQWCGKFYKWRQSLNTHEKICSQNIGPGSFISDSDDVLNISG